MINLKDKLKQVVRAFKKEPAPILKGLETLKQVNRAAVKTSREIQAERERSAR